MKYERVHQMSESELAKYPIEKGVIKVIILDGVKVNGYSAVCPTHGDTVIHTHNGKGSKIKFNDEFQI